MRTPLTYYEGKQRLAARIVALMPLHDVYLEPFAGGAAVLFAKPRAARETLNDLDGRVVRFWRALRDRPEELARAVALTPYSRREWETCRAAVDVDDDVEASRRFLVVGGSVVQSRRDGLEPAVDPGGSPRCWQAGCWENLPEKLAAAAARLSGVALEHGDAIYLIARYDEPKWRRCG